MKKFNRIIFWVGLSTIIIVATCVALPQLIAGDDRGSDTFQVITAISLTAGYLLLVIGILVVGGSTYGNLALRRADNSLETPANRAWFYAGTTFCLGGLGFIFFAVL